MSATIAVVGIKDDRSSNAHRIPLHLQSQGYHIIPINPKLERVPGEAARPSLAAIDVPVRVPRLWLDSRRTTHSVLRRYSERKHRASRGGDGPAQSSRPA